MPIYIPQFKQMRGDSVNGLTICLKLNSLTESGMEFPMASTNMEISLLLRFFLGMNFLIKIGKIFMPFRAEQKSLRLISPSTLYITNFLEIPSLLSEEVIKLF